MTRSTDVDSLLLRLLAGELPPDRARELDRRLAAEPELAARLRLLERSWAALAPPAASPVPPALTARVMAELRRQREGKEPEVPGALSWRLAPTWVRAAAALALAAGVALGAGWGLGSPPAAEQPPLALSAPGIGISPPESLASSYWTAIEEATAESAAEPTSDPAASPPGPTAAAAATESRP